MRRQFTATVVGVSPTTTSGNCGGAHAVTMTLDGHGSCAPMPTNIELPLFNAEEARTLGSLYRIHHAVRVTFETPGVPDVSEEKADNRRRPQEDDRTEPARPCPTAGFIQVGVFNGIECSCPATSEYDPPCPRHGVVGIGVTPRDVLAPAPVPPMVNGRPSCCERMRDNSVVFPTVHGWCISCKDDSPNEDIDISFCPFCGAKLPEDT